MENNVVYLKLMIIKCKCMLLKNVLKMLLMVHNLFNYY